MTTDARQGYDSAKESAERCVEPCDKPADHPIHDPAEGEHPFRESAEPEEWIEQAAKMIDEWFIQKNFNYTANTRAMIADIIRRKWYAQKGK